MGALTPAQRIEVCAMFADGEPIRDIVEKFGCSSMLIHKTVRAAGLPRRDIYRTKWALEGGRFRPWLWQRAELEALIVSGRSEQEAASSLNRTYDGVRGELRKMGFFTSTSINTELFQTLVRCGLAASKTSELIGHCVGEGRWPAAFSDRELIKRMDDAGASNREIAEMLSVKLQTVYRWRRVYELPKPKLIKHGSVYVLKDHRSRILPDGIGGIA